MATEHVWSVLTVLGPFIIALSTAVLIWHVYYRQSSLRQDYERVARRLMLEHPDAGAWVGGCDMKNADGTTTRIEVYVRRFRVEVSA